jgi:hypothetical protein
MPNVLTTIRHIEHTRTPRTVEQKNHNKQTTFDSRLILVLSLHTAATGADCTVDSLKILITKLKFKWSAPSTEE